MIGLEPAGRNTPNRTCMLMPSELLEIPILPLPNVVLFPRTLLPLHIFESRYRKMTADSLQGSKQLGVVLIRKPYGSKAKPEEEKSVLTHTVLCVGSIVNHQILPEGQFNLKLEGLNRAIIRENIPSWPYRRAKVEIVGDRYDVSRREELMERRERLEQELALLAEAVPHCKNVFERILAQGQHPGILADLASTHFVPDPYDRQSILSEFDLIRRIDMVAIQMELLNRRVRRAHRKAT